PKPRRICGGVCGSRSSTAPNRVASRPSATSWALLRQPGGFEGCVELVGKEATDDDAVSKRPAISALGLHLNPVPAYEVGGRALNDVLTSVDQLVDLDTHGLPRFQELLYPTQGLIRSSGDPAPLT